MNLIEHFIDGKIYIARAQEQFLDVIRGDTHKILSGVYRTLKNLGCEDLPDVEEQFQIIEKK